ncbi:hypothetical protein KV697_13325 [Sphingomonas sanguinis]|uniref:hypothetical protein n=1 Tax=Sphingomonas sanguinis TaxID=33051 RepID=UPI001C55D239|nr:hypothetical protein [Sphingomonas sanguinis]QXT34764.1 hypothetical protein KV697_13325 [Sphingomonas sanguinis]
MDGGLFVGDDALGELLLTQRRFDASSSPYAMYASPSQRRRLKRGTRFHVFDWKPTLLSTITW